MNLQEVSEMTGIEQELLRRMRSRETVTLKSGPPFKKTFDKDGNTVYVYHKVEVKKWMERSCFRITAADAARILGISRNEILSYRGEHSWMGPKGKLVINARKNIFIWIPKVALGKNKLKKKGKKN